MALVLATNRNRLLLVQIGIQTATMGMALCSAVSGWFGMNLFNGSCGPEGCELERQGYSTFLSVVLVSVVIGAALSAWVYHQAKVMATGTTTRGEGGGRGGRHRGKLGSGGGGGGGGVIAGGSEVDLL